MPKIVIIIIIGFGFFGNELPLGRKLSRNCPRYLDQIGVSVVLVMREEKKVPVF